MIVLEIEKNYKAGIPKLGVAESYTNNKRLFGMFIILTVKGRGNF